MVKSRSFIATPPGATIKEQLLDRGLRFWNRLEATYREKLVKANAENDINCAKL